MKIRICVSGKSRTTCLNYLISYRVCIIVMHYYNNFYPRHCRNPMKVNIHLEMHLLQDKSAALSVFFR